MSDIPTLQQLDRTYVRLGRRKLIYFGGCDYFRLASDRQVMRAERRGAATFGLNVSASRRTTGNHEVYEKLEGELAVFFGTQAAVLTPTGYLTSLITAQALSGSFSHVLLDSRGHPALKDAAVFMGCAVLEFATKDPASLERTSNGCGPGARILVMTDGLFSDDGSVAPLREYLRVLPPSAMVLVDDAHGAGVLGRNGRGTPEHAGASRARIIQTITLSKAFGTYGGAILGSRSLRAAILARSRSFAGSTPIPPPLANAALAAVKILSTRGPHLRGRLFKNIERVRSLLADSGLNLPRSPGPIIRLLPGNPNRTDALKNHLLDGGIHPPFIHYTNGPESGYFRFAISSEHSPAQLDRLGHVLGQFASDFPAEPAD